MSLPSIPDIIPEITITREKVINLAIASIALEELGLAHILNAEGEKPQKMIVLSTSLDDLFTSNKSISKSLRNVIKKEMLLQFKLEDLIDLIGPKIIVHENTATAVGFYNHIQVTATDKAYYHKVVA